MTADMQAFQNAGESYRQAVGIDGTAGDAMDRPHTYTVDGQFPGICIICGLSGSAKVHT